MNELFFENGFKLLIYGLFLVVPFYVMAYHFNDKRLWITCGVLTVLLSVALAVEWWVKTPREEVESAIGNLVDVVENNDVQGLLQYISKSKPNVVSRAEHEMPSYDFSVCNIFKLHSIKVDEKNRRRATADFMVRVNLSMRGYSGAALRDVVLTFEKESDDVWRIVDYAHYDPANRSDRQSFFY